MLKQHWTSAWEDGSYDTKDFMEVVLMEKENMAAPSYYRSVFQRVAELMEQSQHTHSSNSIKHEKDVVNREPPQLTPSLNSFKLEKDIFKREPLTNTNEANKKQLYTAYKNETHMVQQLKRQLEVANNENMEKERNLQNILQYIDDQLALTTINNNDNNDLMLLQHIQYQENMINQNMVALNEQRKEIEDTKGKLVATLRQTLQLDDAIERTTAGIYNMNNKILDAYNESNNRKNYIRISDTFLSLAPTMASVLENPPPELRDAMISFLNANSSTTSTTSNNYTSQLLSELAAIIHEPSTMNSSDQSFPQAVSSSPMTSSHDTPSSEAPSSEVTPLDDIPYSPSLSDSPLPSLDDIPSSVVASPQHIPDSPLFSLDDIPSSVVASPQDIFYSAMTTPEHTFYSTMTSPQDIDRSPTATSIMASFPVDYHQESM